MTNILRLLAAAALVPALTACATVTRGTTTQFKVDSTPPGASVKTSTGFNWPATPCTFKMPRKEEFDVTLSKAGFKTHTSHVHSQMAGGGAAGMAGNVLVGGLIGIGVDATSGALNDLTPNPLHVSLSPEEPAPRPEESPAKAAEPGSPPVAESPAPVVAAATQQPSAAAESTAITPAQSGTTP